MEALKHQLAEANDRLSDYQEQIRMLREQNVMKDALIRFTDAPDEKAKAKLFGMLWKREIVCCDFFNHTVRFPFFHFRS